MALGKQIEASIDLIKAMHGLRMTAKSRFQWKEEEDIFVVVVMYDDKRCQINHFTGKAVLRSFNANTVQEMSFWDLVLQRTHFMLRWIFKLTYISQNELFTRPYFFCDPVDLLLYESKPTDKWQQYDCMIRKKLDG